MFYWYVCPFCAVATEVAEEQVGGQKPITCKTGDAKPVQGVVYPCWRSDGDLAIKEDDYRALIMKEFIAPDSAFGKSYPNSSTLLLSPTEKAPPPELATP